MPRTQILTNNGETQYREARANGTSAVTVKANATLAADIDFILPVALPAGTEFLAIDSSGQLTTAAGAGGTLDQAYDSGGAGAGRIITADAGAVEIAGTGGLLIDHTNPFILFQTGAVDNNWRLLADVENDFHIQQSTTQDDDASNDTWLTAFAIDAATRQIGINTAIPLSTLHVLAASGAGSLRIQSDASQDITSFYNAAGTNLYAAGYDFSSLGFMIAETGFSTAPRLFIEDTTGDVGINELVPDAKLHVTSGAVLTSLVESTVAGVRIGFRDSGSTDETKVFVGATDDGLDLGSGGAVRCVIDGTGRFGINRSVPAARLHIVEGGDIKSFFCERDGTGATTAAEFENAGGGDGLLLDQNGPGTGLRVDSESTINPLIALFPLTANVRGDIAFGTSRTADPASPIEGDLWYDATLERFQLRLGVFNRTIGCPYGPSFASTQNAVTIAAGVVTISGGGIIAITAEGGGPTDTLDTINSGPQAQFGDTILLRAVSGDQITLGNGTGNMKLNGSSVLLNSINDNCVLFWNASNWVELSRVLSAVA